MKQKIHVFLIVLAAFVLSAGTCPAWSGPGETATQVANALQSGSTADVAKHFNTMIDLTLPGYDDTFSKSQATQILKDFFAQYPVKSFKVTRQGTSPDGSHFTIGTLETGRKSFRAYYIIKNTGGQYLLHQLQLQDN